MKKELLRIDNGKISLNLYQKLNGLYLNVLAGEAVGMIFASLHEKEALIRVLQGDCAFSSGCMYLGESNVTDPGMVKNGIHVISRGTTFSEHLTICENLFFDRMPPLLFRLEDYREMLSDLLEQFHLDLDPDSDVRHLSHGELVALDLVKAYVRKKRIIVLADLTAYLTTNELNSVLTIATVLKKMGFGFVIIESFWDMIFRFTENIAIIKYGRTTGMFHSSELNIEKLRTALRLDMALEDNLTIPAKHFLPSPSRESTLMFKHVHTGILSDVTFSLTKGKMMKILYLDEASCAHMLALLRGERQPLRGEIILNGIHYRPNGIRDAQRCGLFFVEDNPQEKMLLHNMSVYDNLALLLTGRMRGLWQRKRFQKNIHATAAAFCGEDICELSMQELTPVQLQKLVYCKFLLVHPSVIVCINPFSGMDYQVDSVAEKMLLSILDRGTSVLILASYFPGFKLPGKLYYLENGRLTL